MHVGATFSVMEGVASLHSLARWRPSRAVITSALTYGGLCLWARWRPSHTLCPSELHHSDAGTVGKRDLALHHFHALEAVVGDEQVAVEVGEVNDWRELRGRADGT